jgi:hypothetical protein
MLGRPRVQHGGDFLHDRRWFTLQYNSSAAC